MCLAFVWLGWERQQLHAELPTTPRITIGGDPDFHTKRLRFPIRHSVATHSQACRRPILAHRLLDQSTRGRDSPPRRTALCAGSSSRLLIYWWCALCKKRRLAGDRASVVVLDSVSYRPPCNATWTADLERRPRPSAPVNMNVSNSRHSTFSRQSERKQRPSRRLN